MSYSSANKGNEQPARDQRPPPRQASDQVDAPRYMGGAEIMWACAWMPVLAVQQGLDPTTKIPIGVGSRVVKRTDLAARLGVSADKPIGAQLIEQGRVSYENGRLIDGGYFQNQPMRLQLRIDDAAEDVISVLSDMQAQGLIDELIHKHEDAGYLFVELQTQRFIELAHEFSMRISGLAVLLSIDGAVLYM